MRFDEIGYWSELKLEIIRKYAQAYSRILSAQQRPRLSHVYIDGFSGAGLHLSKAKGDLVPGSPVNAMGIVPPFVEYFLMDLDGDKVAFLRELVGNRKDVHIFEGDCNQILLHQVFPKVRFDQYRRGLCLLDPYGLHLDWRVIAKAAEMGSIEIFLNFPIMDMNRNALWRDPGRATPKQRERITHFWGDDTWATCAYKQSKQLHLFDEPELEKQDNEDIAEAFRERLKKNAGFACVPQPLPMRNTKGVVVYYLYFASQKPVAAGIVDDIFAAYRNRMS